MAVRNRISRCRSVSEFVTKMDEVVVVPIGTDQTPIADDVIYNDRVDGYNSHRLASKLSSNTPINVIVEKLMSGAIVPVEGYALDKLVQILPSKSLLVFEGTYSSQRSEYDLFFYIGLAEKVTPIQMLATIIDIDPAELDKLHSDPDSAYTRFPLKKKSGKKRWINAPNDLLKQVQARIKDRILYRAYPTKYAHGFVCHRNIVTNAMPHVGKRVVINMDIKGFFDTITDKMVENALLSSLPREFVYLVRPISRLCTIEGKNHEGEKVRVTPQGAPTSPVLSNLVSKFMDLSLKGVAKNFQAVFTRYADDMTFSSDNLALPKAIPIIMKVVNEHGFWVNTTKTNVFRRGGRMIVTGLVVNDKVSVPRQDRMTFRAHLHHILTGKVPITEVDLNKIQGYANYLHMVNPEQGQPFVDKVKQIATMVNGETKKPAKAKKARKGKRK